MLQCRLHSPDHHHYQLCSLVLTIQPETPAHPLTHSVCLQSLLWFVINTSFQVPMVKPCVAPSNPLPEPQESLVVCLSLMPVIGIYNTLQECHHDVWRGCFLSCWPDLWGFSWSGWSFFSIKISVFLALDRICLDDCICLITITVSCAPWSWPSNWKPQPICLTWSICKVFSGLSLTSF